MTTTKLPATLTRRRVKRRRPAPITHAHPARRLTRADLAWQFGNQSGAQSPGTQPSPDLTTVRPTAPALAAHQA
jgi:hypothetical protein